MWKNIPIIKNIDFDGFYIRMNEVVRSDFTFI